MQREKTRYFTCFLFLLTLNVFLIGCATGEQDACPVTDPIWARPPKDSAVGGESPPGYYFVNADRSIWASAWWVGQDESYLNADEDGIKIGWFRPAGAELTITGERTDANAPPLEAHVPCCYPTQFQATGLDFPTAGCWAITSKAEDKELSFILWVEP